MKSILNFSVMILMLLATSVAFATPPPGDCDTPIAYELSTDLQVVDSEFNWTSILTTAMIMPVFRLRIGDEIVLSGKHYKECQDHVFTLSMDKRKIATVERMPDEEPPEEKGFIVVDDTMEDGDPTVTKEKLQDWVQNPVIEAALETQPQPPMVVVQEPAAEAIDVPVVVEPAVESVTESIVVEPAVEPIAEPVAAETPPPAEVNIPAAKKRTVKPKAKAKQPASKKK